MSAMEAPAGLDPETGERLRCRCGALVSRCPRRGECEAYGHDVLAMIATTHASKSWKLDGFSSFPAWAKAVLGYSKGRIYQLLNYISLTETVAAVAELDTAKLRKALPEGGVRGVDCNDAEFAVATALRLASPAGVATDRGRQAVAVETLRSLAPYRPDLRARVAA